VRHLVWDYGVGFELETARAGSKALFAATGVLTVATWIVIFAVR
jgi:succinate dehydrogenase/fumarate reductase cytochrome b subunit